MGSLLATYASPTTSQCPQGTVGKWSLTGGSLHWECNPVPSVPKTSVVSEVPIWQPASYSPRTYDYKPKYTPELFNMNPSVSGGVGGSGGCGCMSGGKSYDSNLNQLPQRQTPSINIEGTKPLSFGDALKDLFGIKPMQAPVINSQYPDSALVDTNQIIVGVIGALVVAGILYVVHRATGKK